MNKFLRVFFLVFFVLNLSGCIGTKHICDENCVPICMYYAKEQKSLSKEDWEKFKSYKPFRYRRIGDPVVDESMIMYEKISNQLYREVIIPYIEQDIDGSLAEYRAIKKQVEFEMQSKNLNRQEATSLVLATIKAEKPESYGKILHTIRLVESRDGAKQFGKILARISPNLIRLLDVLHTKHRRHSSNEMQIVAYVYMGVILIPELAKALEACSFLSEVYDANNIENREIMKFIKEHENF